MPENQPETVFLHGDTSWQFGAENQEALDREDIDALFSELAPVYQKAFAEAPWNERSRCPTECLADRKFCETDPGTFCERGRVTPETPAYPERELLEVFREAHQDNALFAIERMGPGEKQAALGTVMWMSDAEKLFRMRYDDRPEMHDWLVDRFGDLRFIYRDEVFADRELRPSNNLRHYDRIIDEAVARFGCPTLLGRTINVRLLGKLHSLYGERLTIFSPALQPRGSSNPLAERVSRTITEQVPDDRYLALIELD